MSKRQSNDGSELEKEFFKYIRDELARGNILYTPQTTRIYPKKTYRSLLDGREVNFENVVEAYLPTEFEKPDGTPSVVTVYECKDHGRPIEVKYIDELLARTRMHFGFPMKAYLVSRSSFSSGALKTARANGIGLIRVMEQGEIHHIMGYITKFDLEAYKAELPKQIAKALQNEGFESEDETFYAFDNGYGYVNLRDLIRPVLEKYNLIKS